MKALLLIGNNVKYDTRVKRHTLAISQVVDSVHVLARPIPDNEFGLKKENIEYSFFDYEYTPYPMNRFVMDFASVWNLEEIFLKCFPILACDDYYNMDNIIYYNSLLDMMISGDRWCDIRNRKSENLDLDKALSYPLVFFDCSVQYAKKALEIPADVVVCNDIDTLLCGVVHKLKYNSRLIYDFHDIAADITENVFPQMYSNVLALFEKHFIQYADVVMSVSGAGLAWSKRTYGYSADGIAMLNCSDTDSISRYLPVKTIPNGNIRIYYHGMSDVSRGLLELIYAVENKKGFEVVLRCLPSANLEHIKEEVKRLRMNDRVLFLEPVEPMEIPSAANRDGDIGFHMCDTNKCLNWRFALTNKFIEYTKAGLPIISSATEEQGRIVKKYKNGWILEKNSQEGISKILDEILKQKSRIPSMSEGSFRAADEMLRWDKYREILQGIIVGDKRIIEKNKINESVNYFRRKHWDKQDKVNWNMVKSKL